MYKTAALACMFKESICQGLLVKKAAVKKMVSVEIPRIKNKSGGNSRENRHIYGTPGGTTLKGFIFEPPT